MSARRMNRSMVQNRVDDGIKEAFAWPFYAQEQCMPDDKAHLIAHRTFHLNGYFVVLYNTQLFPGITFRALDADTGDLNTFTQDVKFEVNIPTIGGYFYEVSEDKSAKPVHVRGSFKIKYGTAIAKGINSFFLDGKNLQVTNMAIDFQLDEKPRVTLYSHEPDGSMSQLDSDREGNGAKVAEIMWPSVRSLIYRILRDKLSKMGWRIQWSVRCGREEFTIHETRRRAKLSQLMNDIVMKLRKKLREKTKAGRLPMPDIDVMVASRNDPELWGRFKATSGWLANVTSMRVNDHTAVHARSDNELVIVGQINFRDWKYSYDEYAMEGNAGSAKGEIVRTLRDNEAFFTITAIRSAEGDTILKNGRFEYVDSGNFFNDVTRLGDFDWLKKYINAWMSGVMEDEKPNLNKLMNDCLNEVLVDVDLFGYWDELKAENAKPQDSSEDDDELEYESDDRWTDDEDNSPGAPPYMAWECFL